jgi:FkbH-like protein
MLERKPDTLREEIDQRIADGDSAGAQSALGVLWRANPRPTTASFVLSRFEKIRSALPVAECKVAILRSFTVEPAVPLLRAAAAVSGIHLTVHVGDFNAYAQEILDPAGSLYQFAPDVVILAVQSRDLAPDLWTDFAQLDAATAAAAVERVCENYTRWVEICRSRSQCNILIHNLEVPFRAANGILDSQREDGQAAAFRRINRHLASLPAAWPGVYVLDYDGLTAQVGRSRWSDERAWAAARLPIAAPHLPDLASEWLRFLHPLTGKVCKVLAVDLDNTLWGGVIGEDGLNGIQLGDDYPGVAFRNLQRAILDLAGRGIVLAVCSKNNPAEALEALEKHPQMLLRPADFAAVRINWTEKAQNLRDIAAELNLGLDAIAFLDDNPVERDWVRRQAPEVTVIDLPADPMEYAATLREAMVFERLSVSAEDRERGRYYAGERLRGEVLKSATSVEEFLQSLEMQVEIAPVSPATLARVAQLTQKTNQFNLTTRRYTEQQLAALAADPLWSVDAVTVRDRFGDSGIVGVAITRAEGLLHQIDTFLLSCRVIGRTVETAMLSYLACRAKAAGANRIAGEFIPTRKNAPARDFYASHGFRCTSEQEGASHWELGLAGATLAAPPWLEVTLLPGDHS